MMVGGNVNEASERLSVLYYRRKASGGSVACKASVKAPKGRWKAHLDLIKVGHGAFEVPSIAIQAIQRVFDVQPRLAT
jgi:hypothetical protein